MADAQVLQIAHSACSGFVAFLDHWQTLIGAVIGGVMGVAGALIVAARATQRERRIAGAALLPELQNIRGAHGALAERAAASKRPASATNKYVCLSLLRIRPVAIVLHSSALGQLSDVDAALYAHLQHCQMIHRYFEQELTEFGAMENDAKAPAPPANVVQIEERLHRKAANVVSNWNLVAEHAASAEYLLDRFVFRHLPVWVFKLKMRLSPNDLDQRSAYLLKNGRPLSDAATNAKAALDEDAPI